MDIRSFFGKKPEKKSNEGKVVNKKKRLVISDSDDDDVLEIPVPIKKRKTESPGAGKKASSSQPNKQTTAPTDFFGSSKVKTDTKPIVKKNEAKADLGNSNDMDKFSDEELFDDVSFMETLDQIDKKTQKLKENITPPKGAGLSEKLFEKKKVLSWKEKVGVSDNKEVSSKKRRRDEEDHPSTSATSKHSENNTRKHEKVSNDRHRSSSGSVASPCATPVRKPSSETSISSTPTRKSEELDDSLIAGDSQGKKGKAGYWAYKNREGPKNLGSKEVPQGAVNCLEGLTFVISGVLDSIERDEAANLIKRYGGRVTSAVSKKTSYLVAGEGCGAKKLESAEKHKTKQIDEDGLFELIRSKPGKKSSYDIKVEKEHQALVKEREKTQKPQVRKEEVIKQPELKKEETVKEENKVKKEEPVSENKPVPVQPASGKMPAKQAMSSAGSDPWTEKYRPARVKDIIGQQGDRSNVNKLLKWLKNWERWNKPGTKAPFNKDDGSHLKAALLSGPPGVGKTTSATVCSRELGFTYVELNASDARSKKSIQHYVADMLDNHTINGLLQKGAKHDKHVLIMDEVDGMAGNEDRGGVFELIQLIKSTRIPVICICNDRNHQKIRSLSNHCLDLRFYKPRVEQVKGAMMSIAFKEGLRIPAPAMQKIVEGANSDIRQILNHICMWSAGNKSMTFDEASKESNKGRKDMKIGIFDIPRLFFCGGEETRRYTYADYNDLFFQDYSMTPFFMHENYPRSRPMSAQNNTVKTLKAMSNTADSICFGDNIGAAIKMENWSLLPTQAHFSAIMPGFYMRGGLSTRTEFPQVLGQTSKRNRCDGILQDLLNHMILHVNTDKRQLGMEYLPLLKSKLLSPLLQKDAEGVPEVLDMMNCYDLQRDDWDSVMELSTYSPNPSPTANLSTKTKTAFTRLFNKQSHMNPYALESAATKKKKTKPAADGNESGVEEESDGEGNDAMIKPKKVAAKKTTAKKPAAKKPAVKKTAAKKPTAKK